jgi:hypothetical protein
MQYLRQIITVKFVYVVAQPEYSEPMVPSTAASRPAVTE